VGPGIERGDVAGYGREVERSGRNKIAAIDLMHEGTGTGDFIDGVVAITPNLRDDAGEFGGVKIFLVDAS